MSIPPALPWHAVQWSALRAALDQGRVHPALLVEGMPGIGKQQFAERVAAALLCEARVAAEYRPCGECRSCLLVAAGSHPDRLMLTPHEDRSVIDVEQVRQRIAQLSLTAHYATRRVIVVSPADALNRHAANTLLKTLEEPPGGAQFVLVSARPASLPATVRSRCAALRLHAPEHAQAVHWLAGQGGGPAAQRALEWCGGAPLAALVALQSGALDRFDAMMASLAKLLDGGLEAVQAAADWRAEGLRTVTQWQLRAAVTAMRIKVMRDPGHADVALQAISSKLDLPQLAHICDELLELRSAVERQLHPGDQLALEGLAVSWREAVRRSG